MLGDSSLFDERRFKRVSLTEETRSLVVQKPQGDALLRLNRSLLEEAYPMEIAERPQGVAGGDEDQRTGLNILIDCIQLLVVLGMIVTLYLVRRENRYGGRMALATGERIFKEALEHTYPLKGGKRQLKKFKEYFLYFWCVTFLLYVVFLLDHLQLNFCSDGKGSIALTSKILWSNPGCVHPPAQGSIAHMIKIMLYPFLEFSLGTLNLLFIFWCFVVLRSPAFDKRAIIKTEDVGQSFGLRDCPPHSAFSALTILDRRAKTVRIQHEGLRDHI